MIYGGLQIVERPLFIRKECKPYEDFPRVRRDGGDVPENPKSRRRACVAKAFAEARRKRIAKGKGQDGVVGIGRFKATPSSIA